MSARITTIKYRRQVSTGPYETEEFEVTAEVLQGEAAARVAARLRQFVNQQLGRSVPEPSVPADEDEG